MEAQTKLEDSDEVKELLAELKTEEAELARLQSRLQAVESDQALLEEKRSEYEPLEAACQSIENLAETGLSRIFWADLANDDQVTVHLQGVRARIAELGGQAVELEQNREVARAERMAQLDKLANVEDALREAVEKDERRKLEWLVERDESELPWRLQIMPWARKLDDDALFNRLLQRAAIACLVLGVLIPLIDIPIPERNEVIEIPERLVELIRKEQRQMPEAAPIPERKIAKETPDEDPEIEPEVEPEVKPEVEIAEQAAPEPDPEAVRKRVASTGLLAFRESFSSLASGRPSARLGAEATISNSGEQAIGAPQRSMVTVQGPGSSGGINLASLSRDVGNGDGSGEAIEGVALSRVASSIDASSGSDRPRSAGAFAGRTDEEIQIVFDRYKAALYRLYNRELRKDPTLRGQMVLQLTIEPDGTVSVCQLESSDMGAPALADQVVQRVQAFDFGPKEVPPITILYPIDFLPTA